MNQRHQVFEYLDAAFRASGGVGTHAELVHAVGTMAKPAELRRRWEAKGISADVSAYFSQRRIDDELPIAPEVDTHGTHMLFELADVDERRYMVAQYIKKSAANRAQAVKVIDDTFEQYGVLIDINDPLQESA